MLSAAGLAAGKRARRAGVWLLRAQAAEGSWPAADGLGDPIVTALVLRALASAGVGPASDSIKRAARWLASLQRAGSPPAGGGWSGVPGSPAAPTTLATSAVVLALLACGDAESQVAAGRGVAWLARAQRGDGGWDDSPAGEGPVDGLNRASQERGTGPDLERMCQAVEALSRYLSLTV